MMAHGRNKIGPNSQAKTKIKQAKFRHLDTIPSWNSTISMPGQWAYISCLAGIKVYGDFFFENLDIFGRK